jgi:hypothetical protein
MLKDVQRIRVFKNRVLRTILGNKRNKVTGGWKTLHKDSFKICALHHILFGKTKSRKMRWQDMYSTWGR